MEREQRLTDLGKFLLDQAREVYWSQSRLARELEMNPQTLYKYRYGLSKPKDEKLFREIVQYAISRRKKEMRLGRFL